MSSLFLCRRKGWPSHIDRYPQFLKLIEIKLITKNKLKFHFALTSAFFLIYSHHNSPVSHMEFREKTNCLFQVLLFCMLSALKYLKPSSQSVFCSLQNSNTPCFAYIVLLPFFVSFVRGGEKRKDWFSSADSF